MRLTDEEVARIDAETRFNSDVQSHWIGCLLADRAEDAERIKALTSERDEAVVRWRAAKNLVRVLTRERDAAVEKVKALEAHAAEGWKNADKVKRLTSELDEKHEKVRALSGRAMWLFFELRKATEANKELEAKLRTTSHVLESGHD